MINLETPPGFRGLHPDVPVTVYYRHLPHWRQDGATYFVTFRLDDALPQCKLDELARFAETGKRISSSTIQSGLGIVCATGHGEGRAVAGRWPWRLSLRRMAICRGLARGDPIFS